MIRALFALLLGLSLIACAAPEVVEDPLANLEVPPGTDVTLQGVTVHYRDVGEGVPVVLLHGAALDSRMWIGQLSTLAKDHRVIAVDLPGFGKSPTPRGAYSHAVTLAYLLDHLKIPRAHFVGISEGAEDALDFSYRFLDSAITLTLVSPRLGGQQWTPKARASFENIMAAAARGDARVAARRWLEHPLFASAMKNPYVAKRVRKLHFDNDKLWVRGTFPQRSEPRAIDRLREVNMPVLAIVGDQDVESVYEIARKIDGEVFDSQLEVIPRAGHLVNMETPEVFNRALRAFLAEHPTRKSEDN